MNFLINNCEAIAFEILNDHLYFNSKITLQLFIWRCYRANVHKRIKSYVTSTQFVLKISVTYKE